MTLQFMVIAGTTALLMIFPGRTKGIVFTRLAIIKLIQDIYPVMHIMRHGTVIHISISKKLDKAEELILVKALGQTADWFRRALAVEPVKGNLRLSGYSACGQDGGVQLPHGYVEGPIILGAPLLSDPLRLLFQILWHLLKSEATFIFVLILHRGCC